MCGPFFSDECFDVNRRIPVVQLVIHNRPGFWVLACFMETQDHREHTQLGMERVIQIVP
jgi:hypothetical protein